VNRELSRQLFVVKRSAPTPMLSPHKAGKAPTVRLPSGVGRARVWGFQVFKDSYGSSRQQIARKSIGVGAIAARTVVRELLICLAFLR
jgi:hypothetical protein